MRWTILAFSALCLIPCAATAQPPADDTLAAATPVIIATDRDWLEALKVQDAKRIAAPYADDAVFITRSGKVLAGRAAIEAAESRRLAGDERVVDGSIGDDGVTLVGDQVYEWGHATLVWRAKDGATRTDGGCFLTVWRRDVDGTWRIVRNLSF